MVMLETAKGDILHHDISNNLVKLVGWLQTHPAKPKWKYKQDRRNSSLLIKDDQVVQEAKEFLYTSYDDILG